jgi:hypothetical protein
MNVKSASMFNLQICHGFTLAFRLAGLEPALRDAAGPVRRGLQG